MNPRSKTRSARETASRQRDIQRAAESAKTSGERKPRPAHTAPRPQPRNPLPKQHQAKPGSERELDPAPRFRAPAYRGSGKLDGKVALITGGDSGIGRAVAVLFAREGADVAIVYLCEDIDARDTASAVEQEGRRCLTIAGNVADSDFCRRAVEQTVEAFGRLDILVNNAAFQQHTDDIEQLSDAQIEETLRTNIGGYFHMIRAALPHLKAGASIINTGSETGLFGSPGLPDYSATKGAIHALTKSLASKLIERGIRVNAVAPGPVWTPLNPADQDADKIAHFGEKSAMGRPAQPEELSPAYVFLASPITASYINGIVLPVLGGPTG